MQETVKLYRFGRVLVQSRQVNGGLKGERAVLLESVRTLGDKQKPIEAAASRRFHEVGHTIVTLLVHAHNLRKCRSLSQMEPGRVMLIETEVAAEEEEGGDYCPDRRVFDVVVALADAQSLLEQDVSNLEGGLRWDFEAVECSHG